MTLESLLQIAVEQSASDIILHDGVLPRIRVAGRVEPLPGIDVLDSAVMQELWLAAGMPEGCQDFDAAIVLSNGWRFRANLFYHLGRAGAVLRVVRSEIPTLEKLSLPCGVLRRWLEHSSGLILVTGPTNSGKSTTLASCIVELASSKMRHIITVEDPVEYVFPSLPSIITQREVGIDTQAFSRAIRQSLRQSPDVLLVGEIRDPESAVATLQATESGQLVLASIHGSKATDAVERLLQLLPDSLRTAQQRVLEENLIGVLSQKLLPFATGSQIVSTEYFSNEGAVSPLIGEASLEELNRFMTSSPDSVARSHNRSLANLVEKGSISVANALAASDAKSDLALQLKGFTSSSRNDGISLPNR